MNPEVVFEYRKDGVEIIGYEDKLVIKKNGLTIELGYEVIIDLERELSAAGDQLQVENEQLFSELLRRRNEQNN